MISSQRVCTRNICCALLVLCLQSACTQHAAVTATPAGAPPQISEEAARLSEKKLEKTPSTPGRRSISSSRLRVILQKSLIDDPRLGEAWANDMAAQKRADASFALHYPTLAIQGNRLLSQSHKNKADEKDPRFNPGLVAKLNLFSWGAINNQVKRDREKERYFYYKYYETREELGNEITTQYLNALFYHEALAALRESLVRHEKILHNLNIIVENDRGRQSEWVQAKAREVQVRQTIATYETNLETALSRLEKYTGRAMSADKLQDPFDKEKPDTILKYTREDTTRHPTYMAQKAELQSVRSELKASKGRQLPAVNIEAVANRDSREVYLNVSWDLFNRATSHTVAATAQELIAAEARLEQVLRDIDERARTAKTQMQQSIERIHISEEQIQSGRDVVHAYELQFKIARKTLIELLNAYNDLAAVELGAVNARHDFRAAALAYLHAQHKIAAWAGVPAGKRDERYLRETDGKTPAKKNSDKTHKTLGKTKKTS